MVETQDRADTILMDFTELPGQMDERAATEYTIMDIFTAGTTEVTKDPIAGTMAAIRLRMIGAHGMHANLISEAAGRLTMDHSADGALGVSMTVADSGPPRR